MFEGFFTNLKKNTVIDEDHEFAEQLRTELLELGRKKLEHDKASSERSHPENRAHTEPPVSLI